METPEKIETEEKAEPVEDAEEETSNPMKISKSSMRMVAGVLLVLILVGFGYYQLVWNKHNLTESAAKQKVEEFINNNLMQPGTKANITSVTKENGMFKVMVEIGEGAQKQEITSFLSSDGAKFFPSVMDITEMEKAKAEKAPAETKVTEVPKTDKPKVELFVMSYCPYGTQSEKGVLPVLDTLGSKIDYKLKFVSYAMHEKKEIDENLKQYCIQKNEPAKLSPYLKCFLKDDKQAATCLRTALVNMVKLNACVAATDKEFKITESYNDKSTWSGGSFPPFNVDKADNEKYGVKGSPTLVINGVESSAGRDSASMLKAICAGFNTQPKECEASLSATAPSPGFGEGAAPAGASATAGCGS